MIGNGGRYVDGVLVTAAAAGEEKEASAGGRRAGPSGYGLRTLEVGGEVLIPYGTLQVDGLRGRVRLEMRRLGLATAARFTMTTEGLAMRVRRTD